MWIKMLNILKNGLNSKLLLYIIIGFIIYLWSIDRKNLSNNLNRLEKNQNALIIKNSEQIELTKREFKRLYHKEDSIAQSIGIKPKQVQNVIVNNYHYKDTSIIQLPLVPTIKGDTLKFIKPVGCMKVEGYVLNKSIIFTKQRFDDTFTTFLYGKRPHKFLFIKWGKWIIDAKTYSECLRDTIQVEKNLKIN